MSVALYARVSSDRQRDEGQRRPGSRRPLSGGTDDDAGLTRRPRSPAGAAGGPAWYPAVSHA